MVLTQILVDKAEAASLRLSDGYAWHQALWRAFPGRDGQARDFLFRVDDRESRFRVYLLSAVPPTPPRWGQWSTKCVAPGFLSHDRYVFQVKANPTMRRSSDRRRLGICRDDRLREWMARKAAANGFAVVPDSLRLSPPIEEVFVCRGRRGKHVAVEFSGLLAVTDRSGFHCAFQAGIGSAKAFGFGLLMLRPVS